MSNATANDREALRTAWEALKAHRAGPKLCYATDHLARAHTQKLKAALEAAASVIPERDLKLIEAGQASACCCCNAETPVEIWCAFTFDDTEKR